MTTALSTWDKTKNNMIGINKGKRRRIEFVKSEAATSFSASSQQIGEDRPVKPAGKQSFGSKIAQKDKKPEENVSGGVDIQYISDVYEEDHPS
jgi:hypothetical protein